MEKVLRGINFWINYIFDLYHLYHISIWPLTFQCHVNLVPAVIYWMKISDVTNGQNRELFICHANKHQYHHISFFFLLLFFFITTEGQCTLQANCRVVSRLLLFIFFFFEK